MCEVTFNKQLCVIQDLTIRTPIGMGEPQRGVYNFKQPTTEKVQVNKVVSHDIWHCKLGHPSRQALSYISSSFRGSHMNDLCDVCLRAKQTRMSFLLSENKALNCFDLIHCDIWGSYHVKLLCGAQYFLTIVDDAS